jgi:AraC family transcriptional regulator of adaptative response/methylated-DNA-[protein]-cysteine methyltransferase
MIATAMNQAVPDNETCWRIALAKDRRFDGTFVTGVHSTGIYCRPSCPARPPKRENVSFYATPADAEAAGLRACLRCRPDSAARDEAAVRQALALLRDAEAAVPLEKLAAITGYSAAHFQRLFKRAVGLSPAAFVRALKMERAVDALSAGERVTDAVYDAGYSAPSRRKTGYGTISVAQRRHWGHHPLAGGGDQPWGHVGRRDRQRRVSPVLWRRP